MFTREQMLIALSFFVVYVVWGSTYLANWLIIQDVPPFLAVGSRFATAGVLLLGFARLRGHSWPTFREWNSTFIAGFLLLTIGVGGVVWAQQFVDSGLTALLVSSEPIVVVFLLWFIRNRKPTSMQVLGLSLGILGMWLLVGQDGLFVEGTAPFGLAAIALSIFTWAYASVKLPQYQLPKSNLMSTAGQMLMGGATLLVFGLLSGETKRLDISSIGTVTIFTWIYLITFGSILTFTCFNYLLSKVSTEKVASANYVNPVIAMWLGWAINNELLTRQSWLAALVLLSGVFFINIPRALSRRRGIPRRKRPVIQWRRFQAQPIRNTIRMPRKK